MPSPALDRSPSSILQTPTPALTGRKTIPPLKDCLIVILHDGKRYESQPKVIMSRMTDPSINHPSLSFIHTILTTPHYRRIGWLPYGTKMSYCIKCPFLPRKCVVYKHAFVSIISFDRETLSLSLSSTYTHTHNTLDRTSI